MKTIIIAGGSGFLGKSLENYFKNKHFIVKVLTRLPKRTNDIYWNAKDLGDWTKALEYAEALINLTGKSVDCRYNVKNRKLIHDSRIDSTHILGLAINQCEHPPKVWMNSSTATIYKYSMDKKMDELHGEFGYDFSAGIAKSWENAFNSISNPKTRKVVLRISIVLGRNGGAIIPLKRLTKIGMGGKQGSGNQKVSWIHEEDFNRAVHFILKDEALNGNFNLCVPEPINNKILMRAFRNVLRIPLGIPQPEMLLKFGTWIIGTESELVLKSRNVVPLRLLKNKFNFKYSNINIALNNLIN